MPADLFFPLTRKAAAQAALGRLKDACLRPARPDRIAARRGGPPNLLLLGIDTLRYDHLGGAGYGLPTTPHLDLLGGGGTFFTDVTAPAPWTGAPSSVAVLVQASTTQRALARVVRARNVSPMPMIPRPVSGPKARE